MFPCGYHTGTNEGLGYRDLFGFASGDVTDNHVWRVFTDQLTREGDGGRSGGQARFSFRSNLLDHVIILVGDDRLSVSREKKILAVGDLTREFDDTFGCREFRILDRPVTIYFQTDGVISAVRCLPCPIGAAGLPGCISPKLQV